MTNQPKRILISGASGVTSRSVVRSLKLSPIYKDAIFIGMDVFDNKYGLYEGLYDVFYKVPSCNDNDYRRQVETIIKKENTELAVLIPEPEVLYWSESPFNIAYLNLPKEFAKIALSKKRLYDVLSGTGLVPNYQIVNKSTKAGDITVEFPLWVRDFSEGTTSGKGSFKPADYGQLQAWFEINPGQTEYMLSEVLPGRNYACFLLYKDGELKKVGVAERMDYFMAKVSISGITGNTAKGKLLNDNLVQDRSIEAVKKVCEHTKEIMNGLVTVDLKADKRGLPYVTEINLRHVAFTSSFANAGFNIAEYQLLCAENRTSELSGELEHQYPADNLILRDIDGLPVYVEKPIEPHIVT